MDKATASSIDNFLEYFSEPENRVIFASPRYQASETRFTQTENGICSFKEIRMPHLTLLELAFDLKRELHIADKAPAENASSVFVLEGGFTSRFAGMVKNSAPARQHHNVLYTPEDASEHTFNQGIFHAFHLSYEIAFFKSLLTSDSRFEPVWNAIEKKKPVLLSSDELPLQAGMRQTLRDIQQCSLQGATRHLFLEAKALELFTWQIEQILALSNKPAEPGMSKADIEKLHQVQEYIYKNYLQHITLADLAWHFGLNEFKLKSGYKKLFGRPVYQTIHHLRMQTAADLLKNNLMNISEVTDFVGYSNISHFSAAFKKKFGYPPSLFKSAPSVVLLAGKE